MKKNQDGCNNPYVRIYYMNVNGQKKESIVLIS